MKKRTVKEATFRQRARRRMEGVRFLPEKAEHYAHIIDPQSGLILERLSREEFEKQAREAGILRPDEVVDYRRTRDSSRVEEWCVEITVTDEGGVHHTLTLTMDEVLFRLVDAGQAGVDPDDVLRIDYKMKRGCNESEAL